LFDFDGVLTKTATLQAAAWKEMFDAYAGKGRRGPASASGSRAMAADAIRTLRRRVC
jgi:beta-phosphoglucomutase-like phosphatase (HAD superfamily)